MRSYRTFPFVSSILDQHVFVIYLWCCIYQQFILFIADQCSMIWLQQFICLPVDENLDCSQLEAIMNKDVINSLVPVFCRLLFSFLLNKYLNVKWWDHIVGGLNLLNYRTVCQTDFNPHSNIWAFQSLHILTNVGMISFLNFRHSRRCAVVSHCDFNLYFHND